MARIQWKEKMQWGDEQLDELRSTGYAYIRQGKYDMALPIFKGLCVLAPNSSYDHQTLGALYLETNQADEAVKILNQALKLEGDHSVTLLNLCKALFMLNRREEALRLAKVLQNEPDTRIARTANALLLAFS